VASELAVTEIEVDADNGVDVRRIGVLVVLHPLKILASIVTAIIMG